MKYIVIHKDEIIQEMLDEINQEVVSNPTIIWEVEPPEGEPGGVDSEYRFLTTEVDYPNSFSGYKKLSSDRFNQMVSDIQAGKKIYNKVKNDTFMDQDPTGRPIIRSAATIKGWHYQAHSVQFEVNKLGSIYNKDDEGNDLGYAELKVYDDQGAECTTQLSADTDGVKTVVTWKPDFDFEVVSGHVRQLEKETVDSYLYVNAKVATGYPAPNDWLKVPFVQGGVNLKYIGADEPLKTDGRASKLFNAAINGDYFEVIVNHDADLLTNENRHKMSIIFEIYKNPLS